MRIFWESDSKYCFKLSKLLRYLEYVLCIIVYLCRLFICVTQYYSSTRVWKMNLFKCPWILSISSSKSNLTAQKLVKEAQYEGNYLFLQTTVFPKYEWRGKCF